MSNANKTQIGGDHYKNLAVEPWNAMESWLTRDEFVGFLRGNIIKYHARAHAGKGTFEENLLKASHYSQKLQELIGSQTAGETNEHGEPPKAPADIKSAPVRGIDYNAIRSKLSLPIAYVALPAQVWEALASKLSAAGEQSVAFPYALLSNVTKYVNVTAPLLADNNTSMEQLASLYPTSRLLRKIDTLLNEAGVLDSKVCVRAGHLTLYYRDAYNEAFNRRNVAPKQIHEKRVEAWYYISKNHPMAVQYTFNNAHRASDSVLACAYDILLSDLLKDAEINKQ